MGQSSSLSKVLPYCGVQLRALTMAYHSAIPAAESKTHTVITGKVVARWLRRRATVWEVVSLNLSLSRVATVGPLGHLCEALVP